MLHASAECHVSVENGLILRVASTLTDVGVDARARRVQIRLVLGKLNEQREDKRAKSR